MEELDLNQIEEALEPSFSGMQDMLNEVYIKDAIPLLIAEVKRLRQDRAEVRRDALLEGAGIVDQYEKEWEGKSYGSMRECAANIAARLRYKARTGNWFPDQGQGQGKE